MSYYGLTAQQVRDLPVQHGTVFFAYVDKLLVPVVPKEGEWFCEFDWNTDYEGKSFVQDGSLVRYAGLEDAYTWSDEVKEFVNRPRHAVQADYADEGETRTPNGALLVRQH